MFNLTADSNYFAPMNKQHFYSSMMPYTFDFEVTNSHEETSTFTKVFFAIDKES
jgi:hypothetical protein